MRLFKTEQLVMRLVALLDPSTAPTPAAFAFAAAAGVEVHLREGDEAVEDGKRLHRIGNGRGIDEMLLKTRLDGGFDLVNRAYGRLDLGPGLGIEQGDPGAGACGIARAGDQGSYRPASNRRGMG